MGIIQFSDQQGVHVLATQHITDVTGYPDTGVISFWLSNHTNSEFQGDPKDVAENLRKIKAAIRDPNFKGEVFL